MVGKAIEAADEVGFADIWKGTIKGPYNQGYIAWTLGPKAIVGRCLYLLSMAAITATMYGMPLRACIVLAVVCSLWAGLMRGYAVASHFSYVASGASYGAFMAIAISLFGVWGLLISYIVFLALYFWGYRRSRKSIMS